MRKFTKREVKEFNKFRATFQYLVTTWIYAFYYKIMYKLEIQGKENIPKDNNFILAGNHLSAADPFLMIHAVKRPVAYMAKTELFDTKILMRFFLNWLGAFAVNRDKLDVSTIKTALNIKSTKWALGLFPQGKRVLNGKLEDISKGFAAIAKMTKMDILPISIEGIDKKNLIPFKGKVIIKIGNIIPASDNIDDMINQWCESIASMTGLEYSPA